MRKYGLIISILLFSMSLALAQTNEQQAYQSAVDLYNHGDWDQATVVFNDFRTTYTGSDKIPDVYRYLAKLESDPAKSSAHLQRIIDEYPQSAVADDALLGLAQYEYAKGDYKKAADLFHNVIRDYPQSELCPEASYWSANSHNQAGETDLAENALSYTISEYPSSDRAAWALLDWAEICRQRQDNDAAMEKFQRLIRDYSTSSVMSSAYYRYGEVLMDTGQSRDALIAYDRVLDEHPYSHEAALVRGKDLDFNQLDHPQTGKALATIKEEPVREAVDVTPELGPTASDDDFPLADETAEPTPAPAVPASAPASVAETVAETVNETFDGKNYFLQIGAYSNSDNALLLKSTIEDQKTPVSIIEVNRADKTLYRVWVGPYPSENRASAAAQQLMAEKGIRNYLIVTDER